MHTLTEELEYKWFIWLKQANDTVYKCYVQMLLPKMRLTLSRACPQFERVSFKWAKNS